METVAERPLDKPNDGEEVQVQKMEKDSKSIPVDLPEISINISEALLRGKEEQFEVKKEEQKNSSVAQEVEKPTVSVQSSVATVAPTSILEANEDEPMIPMLKINNPDNSDNTNGRWTKEEDALLRKAVEKLGAKNWKRVASEFLNNTRTDVQCLHRWQKVLKPGLVKGPWTKEEDDTIVECRRKGITKWSEIAQHVKGRIGKQCRERWFNHLDPNIRRCEWTEEEDRKLIEGQALLGNRWTQIAKLFLPGRPENAVKNRWNAATRRRIGTKKKVQIESPTTRTIFLNETLPTVTTAPADPSAPPVYKPLEIKKMRPFTKTQARFRQIRPTQDFKDLGNAMDAMVSLAMTGFQARQEEDEEEEEEKKEEKPKNRKQEKSEEEEEVASDNDKKKRKSQRFSDDNIVESLTLLNEGPSRKKHKKRSFQEARPDVSTPSALDTNGDAKEHVLETPTDARASRKDISLSPSPNKSSEKKELQIKSNGRDRKGKGKDKMYFKAEEISQLKGESVPQFVI